MYRVTERVPTPQWGRRALIALALAALTAAAGGPARAQDAGDGLRLGLPIACTPGEDCWAVNFVDRDPGPGARDYMCKGHTYDGHKGTDIAVRDIAAMRKGVDVLASAAGTVVGVRDGMPDVDVATTGTGAVEGRECGNGVRLSHPGGWATQYCHMRRGSLAVRPGDRVAAGDRLGQVGMSGLAQFPHVHIQVYRGGDDAIDPFAGAAGGQGCGVGPAPLWTDAALGALAYREVVLYHAGFAATVPKPATAREGLYADDVLPRGAPVLVLWADAFWVAAGDRVTVRILGPDGALLVDHTSELAKDQARRFVYAGKRREGSYWPAGRYVGEVRLTRARAGDAGPLEIAVTRAVEVR